MTQVHTVSGADGRKYSIYGGQAHLMAAMMNKPIAELGARLANASTPGDPDDEGGYKQDGGGG